MLELIIVAIFSFFIGWTISYLHYEVRRAKEWELFHDFMWPKDEEKYREARKKTTLRMK